MRGAIALYRSWPSWLGCALLTAACATFEESPPTPPPGVFSADVEPPPIGTRWVVKDTSSDTRTRNTRASTWTWTVSGVGAFNGRPVYHVWDGSHMQVFDRATGSWMAVLDKDAKPVASTEPHEGSLSSPLWVGKRWIARYTSHEHSRGRTFYDMTFAWEVVAYEDVELPSGRVKAFRVERVQTDDRSLQQTRTYWYAPELKVIVRMATESLDADDVTEQHRVRVTRELVQYTAAAPAPAAATLPRAALRALTVVGVEVRNNLTLAYVTINGAQRVPFIVDTGASSTAITPAVAARLGLDVSARAPRRRVIVADGRDVSVPFVRVTAVEVGAARVENLDVGVLDVAPDAPAVGGLLGGDFLGRFTVTLDHARRELRLEPRPTEPR